MSDPSRHADALIAVLAVHLGHAAGVALHARVGPIYQLARFGFAVFGLIAPSRQRRIQRVVARVVAAMQAYEYCLWLPGTPAEIEFAIGHIREAERHFHDRLVSAYDELAGLNKGQQRWNQSLDESINRWVMDHRDTPDWGQELLDAMDRHERSSLMHILQNGT